MMIDGIRGGGVQDAGWAGGRDADVFRVNDEGSTRVGLSTIARLRELRECSRQVQVGTGTYFTKPRRIIISGPQ